ncbi:snaclec CHH-B subunit beta-like [Festucalex cinctus]
MALALRSLFLLCGMSGLLTGVWSFPSKFTKVVTCPDDWTQVDCHCYIYQEEERTFADAEAICNILGGNLVSIHNDLENAVVQQLIFAGDNGDDKAWIGLHDAIEDDDDFIWTDGSVENFLNFVGAMEPNDGTGDCVVLDEDDGGWSTADCTGDDEYVCIKEAHSFIH